jgi:NADPH:quinone reductase-like Zn-dependent oxidoreductase
LKSNGPKTHVCQVNIDPGTCIPLPEGVNPDDAATIGIAGETAYRSIVPNVQTGDRVFINGGSSGTGTFGIQIAKLLGCHVTVSCSTSAIELCKELGADEVFDYTKTDLIAELIESGKTEPFDLLIASVSQSHGQVHLDWQQERHCLTCSTHAPDLLGRRQAQVGTSSRFAGNT